MATMITHDLLKRTILQLLPVLVSVVFSQCAIAQKVVTKNWDDGTIKAQETLDKKGFKTGECTYYHENGQLRLREFYVKGRREGTCEGWYDDGTPEFTRSYVLLQRGNGGIGTEPISVKNGKWIEYHTDGSRKKEENFLEGVLLGEVRSWYENGQLEELKTMEDKFENGLYERYFENGQLMTRGQYTKGEKTGDWVTNHSNGQVAYHEIYRSDKIEDGLWRGKYASGQDSLVGTYKNGRKEGTWEAYHENGNTKSKILFKFGMPAGEFIEYYANGAKRSEGAFGESKVDVSRGREEGHWREWYENGQLMSDANYANGQRIGQYSEWYENGQKKFEASYKLLTTITGTQTSTSYSNGSFNGSRWTVDHEDRMEGPAREWYENGQLMSEGVYVKGNRDGLWKEYYSNGNLQMEAIFDRSKVSGSVTEYFENGEVRSTGFYEVAGRKKKRTGRWITYYSNGSRESEGEYIKNERVGRWQEWYENGELHLDAFFESGANQGPFKDHYENGQLRTEGFYKGIRRHKGLQHGVWKHYNEQGELVLTENWSHGRLR